jgi:regulator of protease activity HflC (stomatin/prohibitin superfamily)
VSTLIAQSGLTNIQIAIKHLTLPDTILDALSSREKAELARQGTIIAAEAEAKATRTRGAATIAVKKGLLQVIRLHHGNLEAQALLTLIEMAQGPATTIFPLSTDLTNVLGRVLRRGEPDKNNEVNAVWELLTETQKQTLLERVSELLNQKTGGTK